MYSCFFHDRRFLSIIPGLLAKNFSSDWRRKVLFWERFRLRILNVIILTVRILCLHNFHTRVQTYMYLRTNIDAHRHIRRHEKRFTVIETNCFLLFLIYGEFFFTYEFLKFLFAHRKLYRIDFGPSFQNWVYFENTRFDVLCFSKFGFWRFVCVYLLSE